MSKENFIIRDHSIINSIIGKKEIVCKTEEKEYWYTNRGWIEYFTNRAICCSAFYENQAVKLLPQAKEEFYAR